MKSISCLGNLAMSIARILMDEFVLWSPFTQGTHNQVIVSQERGIVIVTPMMVSEHVIVLIWVSTFKWLITQHVWMSSSKPTCNWDAVYRTGCPVLSCQMPERHQDWSQTASSCHSTCSTLGANCHKGLVVLRCCLYEACDWKYKCLFGKDFIDII